MSSNEPLQALPGSFSDVAPAVRFARLDEARTLELVRERVPNELYVVGSDSDAAPDCVDSTGGVDEGGSVGDFGTPIDWPAIENRCAAWVDSMKATPQNRERHAEGDVWTHTKMACETLTTLPVWRSLSELRRELVFLATLWHDVGKPVCTRIKDGRVSAPKHAARGARVARRLLAERCGLDGAEELTLFREQICYLIEYHTTPRQFFKNRNKNDDVVYISYLTSNELLSILAEADARGRLGGALESRMANVEFFRKIAKQNYCFGF